MPNSVYLDSEMEALLEEPGDSGTPLLGNSEYDKVDNGREAHQIATSIDKPEKEAVNYFHWRHFGLFIQYFIVGICSSFSIELAYEFFRSYLGQSGNFYNICTAAIALPWSLKVFYGALNDCRPICGYRRKPYMVMGWAGCAMVGFALYLMELPEPRYLETLTKEQIDSGHCEKPTLDLKSDSRKEYTGYAVKYMALLFLLNIFLILTDVAMDGLMVEYEIRDTTKKRGRAQSMIYITREVGMMCGSLVKSLGLNWYAYNGPWCKGFHVTELFLIIAIISVLAIPAVLFMTTENRVSEGVKAKKLFTKTWKFLQLKGVQQIIFFQMSAALLTSISSPADSMVQSYWVGLDNLTRNLFMGFAAQFAYTLGASISTKYFLNSNLKIMYGSTLITVVLISAVFNYITVLGVFRDAYFYAFGFILMEFFAGLQDICEMLLLVEIAETEAEGTSYALLNTSRNICNEMGALFGNFICMPFKVSEPTRFERDARSDRSVVAIQYAIVYAIHLSSLLVIPWMPAGKQQARELKSNAGKSTVRGIVLALTVISFLMFAIVYSFGLTDVF